MEEHGWAHLLDLRAVDHEIDHEITTRPAADPAHREVGRALSEGREQDRVDQLRDRTLIRLGRHRTSVAKRQSGCDFRQMAPSRTHDHAEGVLTFVWLR